MSLFRSSFDTVRQLEKQSYNVFAYGGGGALVGLILFFVLPPLGLAALIVSGVVLLGGMMWVSMLGKEAARLVFCPHCSNRNDVYESRSKFDCDVCGRPVQLSDAGEPVPSVALDPNTD